MLVLQSGGPTAIGNTCLAAVVAAVRASDDGEPILGVRHGLRGFLAEEFLDLKGVADWDAVSGSPGAALGSSRYRPSEQEIGSIVETLSGRHIRRVVMIGGNGTMSAAAALFAAAQSAGYELGVAGIPDTIDNDVPGTEVCLGYGSCARYTTQTVVDVAADVRSLPTPVSIVEVMGRNAGWVAAATALARRDGGDAPHRIYLPEVPIEPQKFLQDVRRQFDEAGWGVFVVSEGIVDAEGSSLAGAAPMPGVEGYGGAMVGDVGQSLARLVTGELGLRARTEKPGLAARAAPHFVSALDRRCAEAAGRFAVTQLRAAVGGFMVSIRLGRSGFSRAGEEAGRGAGQTTADVGGEGGSRDAGPGTRPGVGAEFAASPECERVPFGSPALSGGERVISAEYLTEEGEPSRRFLEQVRPLVGGIRHYHRI